METNVSAWKVPAAFAAQTVGAAFWLGVVAGAAGLSSGLIFAHEAWGLMPVAEFRCMGHFPSYRNALGPKVDLDLLSHRSSIDIVKLERPTNT